MASFFEDLLGNAAISGGNLLQDRINQQRKQDDERRQQEMYIERQRAIDEQRMAMEERKRQELAARTGEQMLKVDQTAPAVTTARQLAEGQGRAPSLDAAALDIVKQHLSPEELKSAYGINDNVFTRIDDKLTAAYQGGMYDAAEVLSKQRDRTIETLRAMRQDAVAESTIAANMALAGQRGAKAEAAPIEADAKLIGAKASMKRAERPASGGRGSAAPRPDPVATDARKAADSEYKAAQEAYTRAQEAEAKAATSAARAAAAGTTQRAKERLAKAEQDPLRSVNQANGKQSGAATKELTYDPKTRKFQ